MPRIKMRAENGLTVKESYDFFIRKCTARNLSPNTIKIYKYHFGVFERFLDDDGYRITEITGKSETNDGSTLTQKHDRAQRRT